MTFHSKISSIPAQSPAQSPVSTAHARSAERRALRKRIAQLAPLLSIIIVSLLGLSLAPVSAFAIESPYAASDARAEEQATAEEFATFPAPARRAALVVAGYPESLLEIQRLQQYSADRFAALVEGYPRETQTQIWDLVRYPGLAADLARGGQKTASQLDDLADRYPEADHLAIIEEGKERSDLWVQIYSLDLESQQSLSTILAAEPVEVQAAFEEVTARPELMSLLAENIQWTTVQGAAYRENPAQVDARFATLSERVAARNREAETNWANEVTDPEAAEELETAAREFADTYGYDYEDELEATRSRQAASNGSNTTIIIEQRVNPYPYWFGYPSWYDTAFWYPLSFSSHIGFGYRSGFGRGFGRGFGGRYASFGLPSPFFLGWYHDIYRPRFARNHRGDRRSIRYYDNHRPHRSASHRRHIRNRDLVDARRDRNRAGNRVERRQDRRDDRFRVKRDRRSHVSALADRALREQRRDARAERQGETRLERRERRATRERRAERNLRAPARDQARFTRNDRARDERRAAQRDPRRRNEARAERRQRVNRNDREGRNGQRLRNPVIRPGGRPADRIADRKNDGVRQNKGNLRQARADIPRVSKKERKTERRVERTARKAERRVARTERKSANRIARAERRSSKREARASSGGGNRRLKAAKNASRPQRAAKSNRGGGGSRKGQRQGGGNRGNRGQRKN